MVWKLQATPRKKLGLAAVFATGIFTEKDGDNYYATRIKVWLSLEFSFSIIVACLPTLTPLFKKLSILSTWIPTLRSKIYRTNRSNRSNSKGFKISGPVKDHDIERNALRSEGHAPADWQTPRAWNEVGGKRGWDDCSGTGNGDADDGGTTVRSESDVTLQDLQPVEGDAVGKRREQGLRDFVEGELGKGKRG
ncbi:MAG: hypothetical protein Q9204_007019 [Flavoplaca sp. TL-2023a]